MPTRRCPNPSRRNSTLRTRRVLVSPLHDNIQRPHVLLERIRSLAPGNGHRKRRAVVILPDYCARVAVLDFDTFPAAPEEQLALVRFRLKKSVPFEVDTAVVSYVEQPRSGAKVEILAAVMSSDIVVQYEAPFRAAGFHPGLVTTSSLAALNLLAPDGISLLVKLSGRVFSVLVLQENAVNLARCIEMEGVRLEDIESVLHPTIAYVEDEFEGASEADLAGWIRNGDGATGDALGKRMGGCRAGHPVAFWRAWKWQRRFTRIPGVGGVSMALRVPINLASEPFRRDRPLLVGSVALAVILSLLLIYQVVTIVSERHQAADIRIAIDRENATLKSIAAQQAKLNATLRRPEKRGGSGAQSLSEYPAATQGDQLDQDLRGPGESDAV